MKAAVVMGSKSDYDQVKKCVDVLKDFGVETEVRVISAHRTPAQAVEFAAGAEDRGVEVIIACAGMLVLTEEGLYAARDKFGRTPLIIGCKDGESMCAASESFTFINLGYHHVRDIGPGEVVLIQAESEKTVVEPQKEMRICAFLWSYFGYPPATYEGQNVEDVRNRNGALIAESDGPMDVDYVAGVPDSGVAHDCYGHKRKNDDA